MQRVAHCVQACARDFLAAAMMRLDCAGYDIVLTVHDEILAEQPKGRNLLAFETLVSELPPWGAGCPIEAKGWIGPWYRK